MSQLTKNLKTIRCLRMNRQKHEGKNIEAIHRLQSFFYSSMPFH